VTLNQIATAHGNAVANAGNMLKVTFVDEVALRLEVRFDVPDLLFPRALEDGSPPALQTLSSGLS